MNVLPLAYLGGWYNLTLVPLLAGGTVVLDREFGGGGMYRFWSNVLEHGVNCLWFTPSMLAALCAIGTEDEEQAAAIRAQVRWGMVGMAPLMPALKAKFEAMFGFRLQQSYGLSETFLFTSWMSDIRHSPMRRSANPSTVTRYASAPTARSPSGVTGSWTDTGTRRSYHPRLRRRRFL